MPEPILSSPPCHLIFTKKLSLRHNFLLKIRCISCVFLKPITGRRVHTHSTKHCCGLNPDLVPDPGFDDQKLKKVKQFFLSFWSKIAIYLPLGQHPNYKRSLRFSKENSQHSKHDLLPFSIFVGLNMLKKNTQSAMIISWDNYLEKIYPVLNEQKSLEYVHLGSPKHA